MLFIKRKNELVFLVDISINRNQLDWNYRIYFNLHPQNRFLLCNFIDDNGIIFFNAKFFLYYMANEKNINLKI